ncbi:MAG: hypothetical protein J2P37_00140 [Ktedonobacteraceae bacterium]|nr:hypothetical protein [Ktedonobacteraceae bacterium]
MQEAFRKRMDAKGLSFPLPAGRIPVVMQDEITHTVDFPVCGQPDCICYELEREKLIAETTPAKPARRSKRLVEANYEHRRRGSGFSLLK